MQTVRTVSFPDRQLLADLSPLPEGLRGVVWDLKSDPDGGTLGEIDGVILPYIDASAVLGSLAQVDGLKFVQTQSTGYDGVIEAAGPAAGVASASGVHAAATAELALGLILAKLRGIDQAVRDQQYGLWRPERRQSLADRRVLLVGVGGMGTKSPAAWSPSRSLSRGWGVRPAPTNTARCTRPRTCPRSPRRTTSWFRCCP